MTRESVKVKPGYEYDHYFPKAQLQTILEKRGAKVSDTLKLIPRIVRQTAWQTRRFAKEVIKKDTFEKTAEAAWRFVYDHIAYRRDEFGKEQVRDAARIWHDRHNIDPATGEPMGVDCDCMTTLICSLFYNLQIKHVYMRVTRYEEDHWEHIYPVIKLPGGKEIIVDCVMHQFNQEAKYTEKQDTPMDLEYLNGVPDSNISKLSDAPDLMGIMDEKEAFDTLGRLLKRKSAGGSTAAPKKGLFRKKTAAGSTARKPLFHKKTAEQKKANRAKVKKFIGKGLHVTNRINPVTVALRNGVLAGMKLNFMKIGESLRWTYLSPEQAQAKGADMGKFNKLKAVRVKLEKIFFGAGGKPENLKKAILTGRGNRDKSVPLNGLSGLDAAAMDSLHEDMPLSQLLGREIYHSENVEGLEGLDGFNGLEGFSENGDLGSATAASVAAATTVLGSIAALIKSIGSIFPGKGKKAGRKTGGGSASASGGEEDSGNGGEEAAETSETPGETNAEGADSGSSEAPAEEGDSSAETQGNDKSGDQAESGDDPEDGATNGSSSAARSPTGAAASTGIMAKAKHFWESNKKWLKPASYTVGAIGVIALAYHLLKSKKKTEKLSLSGLGKKSKPRRKAKPTPQRNILSGIKPKKGGKRHSKKNKTTNKKTITLL